MAVFTLSGPVGQGKAVSTAGGGTALTSSAASILLPFRTRKIDLIPRNFSTAVVVQWRKIPWITLLKTTDLLVAVANTTDHSNAAQDGSTSTKVDLSSLATLANGGSVYVGTFEPILGMTIDVQNTNSNVSVLTVAYRKSDNTWADTSATDGTASGGATMAQDGNVTWTEPTDQIACRLIDAVSGIDPRFGHLMNESMFWTRWVVSAALDATTDQNSWVAMPRTTYAEIPSGMSWSEAVQVGSNYGSDSICGISAKTDAGTANLVINAYGSDGGYLPS